MPAILFLHKRTDSIQKSQDNNGGKKMKWMLVKIDAVHCHVPVVGTVLQSVEIIFVVDNVRVTQHQVLLLLLSQDVLVESLPEGRPRIGVVADSSAVALHPQEPGLLHCSSDLGTRKRHHAVLSVLFHPSTPFRHTHPLVRLELSDVSNTALGPGVRQCMVHEVVFVLETEDLREKSRAVKSVSFPTREMLL